MAGKGKKYRKAAIMAGILGVLATVTGVLISGCIHRSGGEWMFKSADLPEGWPGITPVGKVEMKQYPTYRAATVTDADIQGEGMNPMFMTLFRHIDRNTIAMTAPVDMGYTQPEGGEPRMVSMAFLYASTSIGKTGTDGKVRVEDLPPAAYLTTGTRGMYTDARFASGLERLNEWLDANPEWAAAGEPRFLGYNGPLTLWFLRYGEVQIPIRETTDP